MARDLCGAWVVFYIAAILEKVRRMTIRSVVRGKVGYEGILLTLLGINHTLGTGESGEMNAIMSLIARS